MRLHKLHVKNFRKIEDLTVVFPRGLSVIVGENNAGKTAIIDALRLMLFSGRDFDALRLNEDDFRRGSENAPIEISCSFSDLTDDDEVHFQECLVDIGNGKFEARLNSRGEFNAETQRVNIKMWGGETESGTIPSKLYDRIASVYLQPLRDPEAGLRPGRHSQVSRLVDCLTEKAMHIEFENIARDANAKIRELRPIKDAKADIDGQMVAIAGNELSQKTDLIFTDPSFYRIIAGLQAEIAGLPFSLNGLGYNNLVYTAATLGTLKESSQYSFRSILIEEPEAHLHPHLQTLLLRYLASVAGEVGGNEVQVIASSHSPILVSQAPIDSVISIHETGGKVTVVSLCTFDYDTKLKKKLQRFLDATRGEIFFARRILMVEGIAEALLMPILARITGGNLKKSSVTVLNAEGLNFNAFLPLFGNERLAVPVVVLTDGDDMLKTGRISAVASALKAKESEIPNLRVELSQITFEHELAKSPVFLPLMLNAYEAIHPTLGPQLKATIAGQATAEQKADAFLQEFLRTKTAKGEFAQEFAALLDSAIGIPADSVPGYIRNAFSHLGVV